MQRCTLREFGRIPEEVFAEAEKFGVPRGDIVAAAASDRDADGTYCDNCWTTTPATN